MKRFAVIPHELSHQCVATFSRIRFSKLIGQALTGLILSSGLTFNMPAYAAESKAQAQLQVRATVLTRLKINVTSQESQINIEQSHVAQGYIDVTNASTMLVTSNSLEGFTMAVSHDHQMVSRVSANLLMGGVTLKGENQIAVRTRQVRDEPMRISYRVYLNEQARVGSQPWPVALTFSPDGA